MKINSFFKDLYKIRYAILIIIIYTILMQYFFGTICPLKAFFNTDCPACGLTRATIYLFKGNIRKSLSLNPTCILWLSCIILFLVDRYFYKLKIEVFPYFIIVVGLITIFWYFYNKIV